MTTIDEEQLSEISDELNRVKKIKHIDSDQFRLLLAVENILKSIHEVD